MMSLPNYNGDADFMKRKTGSHFLFVQLEIIKLKGLTRFMTIITNSMYFARLRSIRNLYIYSQCVERK